MFAVRVSRNPSHGSLYVGFALPDVPMHDTNELRSKSWLICTHRAHLFERSRMFPTFEGVSQSVYTAHHTDPMSRPERHIREGAVVRVEKVDAQTEMRSLRFLVDGAAVSDPRPTGLSEQEFRTLRGVVLMLRFHDAVEIVECPQP